MMLTIEERAALAKYDTLASKRENIFNAIDRIPFEDRLAGTPEFETLLAESKKASKAQDKLILNDKVYISARTKLHDAEVQQYMKMASRQQLVDTFAK